MRFYLGLFMFIISLSVLNAKEAVNVRGPLNLEEQLVEPEFSPDGRYLSASLTNYRGIRIYDLEKEAWVAKIDRSGSGYQYVWSPDSKSIAFRETVYEKRRRFYQIGVYDLTEDKIIPVTNDLLRDRTPPVWKNSAVLVYFDKKEKVEEPVFKGLKKAGKPQLRIASFRGNVFSTLEDERLRRFTSTEKVIINPLLMKKNNKMVYQEIGKKMKMVDLETREEIMIGEYEMASLAADESFMLLADTKDDGYQYKESVLYYYDAKTGNKEAVENLERYVPGNSSCHPNGKTVAFEDMVESKIYLIDMK